MSRPNPFDDELAALLALDALDLEEQADAELSLGAMPDGHGDSAATLAELTAQSPPADLRRDVVASALSRRAAGRPLDAPQPVSPAEAFDRTIEDLHRLVDSLTATEWGASAHDEHGSVKDLVAHLVGVERLVLRWLEGDEVADLIDHVAATRPVVDELATHDPRAVAAQWYDTARAVAAAAAASDPDRKVTFHDLRVSVEGLLTMRTFELWAHSMDIAVATGRPLLHLDDERMALLSARFMAALPDALAYRRATAPGRTARFVLTGPAGGVYQVPLTPGQPDGPGRFADVTIIADVVDLCRVAARRLSPQDLDATIEGDADLAQRVLADADAFARD